MMKRGNECGFTLIELLITVAIIAILATIAYPSYQQFILESRRADAHSSLLKLQLAQENLRGSCTLYANSIADASNCPDTATPSANTVVVKGSPTSKDGYYRLSISGATGNSFLLTATANGSPQNADTECDPITLFVGTHSDGKSYPNGLKGPLIDPTDSESGTNCW